MIGEVGGGGVGIIELVSVIVVLNDCVSARVKGHSLGGRGAVCSPNVEIVVVLVAADGIAVGAVELADGGIIVEVGAAKGLVIRDPVAVEGHVHVVGRGVDLGPHAGGIGLGAVQGVEGGLVHDQVAAFGEVGGGGDLLIAAVQSGNGKRAEGVEGVQGGAAAVGIVGRTGLQAEGLAGDGIRHLGGGPAEEGIALERSRSGRQGDGVAGHAGDGAAEGLTVGLVGQGEGLLLGEVDPDDGVLGGVDVEGIAVLHHVCRAGDDGIAGGVVAAVGGGGDQIADAGGEGAEGRAAVRAGFDGQVKGSVGGVGLDAEALAVVELAPGGVVAQTEEGGAGMAGMGVDEGRQRDAVFGVVLGLGLVAGNDHLEVLAALLGIQGKDGGEGVARLNLERRSNADRVIAGVGDGSGLGGHQGAGSGVRVAAGQVGGVLVDLQGVAQILLEGADGEGLDHLLARSGEDVGDQGVVHGQRDPALGGVAGEAGAVVLVEVVVGVQAIHREEHDGVAQIGGVLIGDVVVAAVGVAVVAPGVLDDPGAVGGGRGAAGEVGLAVVVVPADDGDAVVRAVVVALVGVHVAVSAIETLIGCFVIVAEEACAVFHDILLDRSGVGRLDPVHACDMADVVGIGVFGINGAVFRAFGISQGGFGLAGRADPAHHRQSRLISVAADVHVGFAFEDGAVAAGQVVLVIGVGVVEIGKVVLRQVQIRRCSLAGAADLHLVFDHERLDRRHCTKGPAGAVLAVLSLILDRGDVSIVHTVVGGGQLPGRAAGRLIAAAQLQTVGRMNDHAVGGGSLLGFFGPLGHRCMFFPGRLRRGNRLRSHSRGEKAQDQNHRKQHRQKSV